MRLKRVILKTLLVAIIIILGLAIWLYLWWNEEPVISVDYVAQFNEMRKPADYRPEDDGGPLFIEVCRTMKKAKKADPMPQAKETNRYQFGYGERLWESVSIIWPTDMSEVERREMRSWMARRSEIFTKLSEAMARKCFWVQLPGQEMDFNEFASDDCDLFDISRILSLRGRMKIAEGNIEGGMGDVFAAMEAGKCFGQKPSFQEWYWCLRSTSEGCLSVLAAASRTELSSNQLARMADEVRGAGKRYDLVDGVLAYERLKFLDSTQRCFGDNGHGDGRMLPGVIYSRTRSHSKTWIGRFTWTMWYCLNCESRRNAIALYDRLMPIMHRLMDMEPWQVRQQQPEAWASMDKQSEKSWRMPGKLLAGMSYWHKTMVGGTVATLQVMRYKKETGEAPDGWEDVVKKGWFAEPPRDIYSGKPFVYKKTAEGFTVYSVGKDGNDDGGDRKKDIVLWPVERVSEK